MDETISLELSQEVIGLSMIAPDVITIELFPVIAEILEIEFSPAIVTVVSEDSISDFDFLTAYQIAKL